MDRVTEPARDFVVTLAGDDLRRVARLAWARQHASPDAIGALAHAVNLVRDAVVLGLAEIERREARPPLTPAQAAANLRALLGDSMADLDPEELLAELRGGPR